MVSSICEMVPVRRDLSLVQPRITGRSRRNNQPKPGRQQIDFDGRVPRRIAVDLYGHAAVDSRRLNTHTFGPCVNDAFLSDMFPSGSQQEKPCKRDEI